MALQVLETINWRNGSLKWLIGTFKAGLWTNGDLPYIHSDTHPNGNYTDMPSELGRNTIGNVFQNDWLSSIFQWIIFNGTIQLGSIYINLMQIIWYVKAGFAAQKRQ